MAQTARVQYSFVRSGTPPVTFNLLLTQRDHFKSGNRVICIERFLLKNTTIGTVVRVYACGDLIIYQKETAY
jgi:hypothetical protein